MLKILDRYIIRKFLTTFFFMLGVIMVLATVFDLSEKLSDFIKNDATMKEVILDYYVNFIIFYGNMFSSMIIFISVIWFTAKMAQDTEIIPIWNSGKPFARFIRPYMIAATILTIIALIFNHFIIPKSNKVRLAFEEKYARNSMYVEDYHAEFPGNQVVYFSSYMAQTGDIENLVVEQWNDKGQLTYFIKAARAKNDPGSKKWILLNYYERTIQEPTDHVKTISDLKTVKNDVIREGMQKDTTFQFSIDEMATRENVAEAMTYFELKEFIEREKVKGNSMVPMYEIELYQRTSYPFASYVLTIIGIAVSSTKKRGGIGISIAIGLGIIFIYIFAMKVTTVAAMNVGFPAQLAVWIPNLLFGAVAYVMYRFAQK